MIARDHRPTEAIHIAAATARRFLARRHLLWPPRSLPAAPASVLAVVDRLGSLQFDPLEVAGRNHDLVLLARVGGYRREWTQSLLYERRTLYEAYNKGLSIVPTAELPWYRIGWDRRLDAHQREAFETHADLVGEILERIRTTGPLSSTDFAPRAAIDWYWRPTNQVRAMLEALAEAGILGIARREGNRRIYDLSERLFPADLLAERHDERDQRRHKLLSRYRAHGMLGQAGSAELWLGTAPALLRRQLLDELIEEGRLVPISVEGVRGPRHVLADELPLLESVERELAAFTTAGSRPDPDRGAAGDGRQAGSPAPPDGASVAFLAPLDPYVWDRDFLRSLHGFDYVWEVYVPEARRRWGYYVLPILFGDRLVGRLEPRIERRTGTLSVVRWWWEAGFEPAATPGFAAAMAEALDAYRRFDDLASVTLPRTGADRRLAAGVREQLAAIPKVRRRAAVG